MTEPIRHIVSKQGVEFRFYPLASGGVEMKVTFGIPNTGLTAELLPEEARLLIDSLEPFASSGSLLDQQAMKDRIEGIATSAIERDQHLSFEQHQRHDDLNQT
jgi:hypothetical protein